LSINRSKDGYQAIVSCSILYPVLLANHRSIFASSIIFAVTSLVLSSEYQPPDELVAVIEPISLLLVVFGGIALLNVVSNIRYKDGKFEYDPTKGKEATKQNINGVVSIIKAMNPFGRKDTSNS
jgi:hypothetical protein